MQFRTGHDNKPGIINNRSGARGIAPCGKSGLLLIITLLALAGTMFTSAYADDKQTANKSDKVIVTALAQSDEPASTSRISLDFVSSDIHDVLKALAMQGSVNIVASPDVKGNITVSLSSVSIEEALKLVANISGYRFTKMDGAYIVGTTENINSLLPPVSAPVANYSTVSIAIRYADMANVVGIIKKQFPTVQVVSDAVSAKDDKTNKDVQSSVVLADFNNSLQPDKNDGNQSIELSKGPSLLVLYGLQDDVNKAKSMVDSIESSMGTLAASTLTELCEIKYADINEVSSLLTASMSGLQVSIGPVQGFNLKRPAATGLSGGASKSASSADSDEKNKPQARMLILRGTQLSIDKAKAFIAQIDTQVPQIMIEAKVVDISNDTSKELGIDWNWDSFKIGETDWLATEIDENGRIKKPEVFPVTFGLFHRTPVELRATVKALVENGQGRILANPNVLALDGKPASIVIGDKIIYVKSVLQGTNGPSIETGEEQVGIQLHTISSINSDGYITMSLHPEVSVITRMIESNGGFLPQIANRYVDSTIRVKDGETVVIGGLIKEEELSSMSGIPILKDLPILGQFFRSKVKSKAKSEIMIFITPKIISSE
ncbi:MAG: type II secretion system protein GspD [Armatimonadota bacterium]